MVHKPIGGVKSVKLYAAATGAVESLSVEVVLVDDRSVYTQQLTADGGVVVVEHTLRLVARREDAQLWLDGHFVERATLQGLQAEVWLNDGRMVEVGLCEQMLYSTPLRLASLTVDSAESVSQEPTVTLTLRSCNTIIN